MACGGRLTIAVYTLRHVHEGEELSFDYASVTESEKEFRAAICLCGTRSCRGSFLYFSGSRAFQHIMNTRHTMLHRQVLIVRAGTEALNEPDRKRLQVFRSTAVFSSAHSLQRQYTSLDLPLEGS